MSPTTEPLGAPDPLAAAALAAVKAEFGGSDWLCLAPIEPASGQENVVKALWAFSRLYGLPARLHLVGPTPERAYLGALRDFVEDLGLVGAVQLVGPAPPSIAAAYVAAADVYVTAAAGDPGARTAAGAGVAVVTIDGGPAALGVHVAGAQPSLVAATVGRLLGDEEFAAAARRSAQRGAQLRVGAPE